MRAKLKKALEWLWSKLKKILLFLLNPRLLLCIAIAWFITNGWSYAMLGVGLYYGINWMIAVATAYLTFLWFPFTPEKIVTLLITIFLLRVLFPKDEKTLGVAREMLNGLREDMRARKKRRAERREEKRRKKLGLTDETDPAQPDPSEETSDGPEENT